MFLKRIYKFRSIIEGLNGANRTFSSTEALFLSYNNVFFHRGMKLKILTMFTSSESETFAFLKGVRNDSLRRRANARNVSFRISLRWLTYIVNSVDKTKLFRFFKR